MGPWYHCKWGRSNLSDRATPKDVSANFERYHGRNCCNICRNSVDNIHSVHTGPVKNLLNICCKHGLSDILIYSVIEVHINIFESERWHVEPSLIVRDYTVVIFIHEWVPYRPGSFNVLPKVTNNNTHLHFVLRILLQAATWQFLTTHALLLNDCKHKLVKCHMIVITMGSTDELRSVTWRWRHNGREGVSNHLPHDCSLNRLFGRGPK